MIRQRSLFTLWQVLVVMRQAAASGVLAGVGSLLAEEGGERVDDFVEQGVDAGLLVGEVPGLVAGGGAAVLGLGGELAVPGGHGGVDGGVAVWAGGVSRG
jgi:hypothetical protein